MIQTIKLRHKLDIVKSEYWISTASCANDVLSIQRILGVKRRTLAKRPLSEGTQVTEKSRTDKKTSRNTDLKAY